MVDSSLKDRVYPRGSSVILNFPYYTYLSSLEDSCETRRLRKEMFTRGAEPSVALPPQSVVQFTRVIW